MKTAPWFKQKTLLSSPLEHNTLQYSTAGFSLAEKVTKSYTVTQSNTGFLLVFIVPLQQIRLDT